ncbi:hypothetical protein [Thalassospira sp. MBR-102]|jgi:hypothetical protein|uniref:hypothetical protein n=1 Tax=Thalassospira sp. MBR-102 TaxID=3156466 RepID=UPI00339A2B1B
MREVSAETELKNQQAQAALEADVRSFVLENLPHDRNKIATGAKLEAMTAKELLSYYLYWLKRIVPPQPRRVHLSSQILLNPLFLEYKKAFPKLRDAIERGVSLQPYLSNGVAHGYYRHRALKEQRHLDLLLSDWGIHHLHLEKKENPKENGFGSDHLLFCIFKETDAYLIDIFPHDKPGVWADRALFRIVVENWSKENLFGELAVKPENPEGVSDDLSAARRHIDFRNRGIIVPIEVDGKIYVSSEAMLGAGIPLSSNIAVDEIWWLTLNFYIQWFESREGLATKLLALGAYIHPTERPRFHINLDGRFGVTPKSRDILLALGKVPL